MNMRPQLTPSTAMRYGEPQARLRVSLGQHPNMPILRRAGILFALLLAAGSLGVAGENPPNPEVSNAGRKMAEQLTTQLLALHAQYSSASAAQRPQVAAQLRSLAAARQKVLATLIKSDPAAVLRVALPSSVRANVPPSVQAMLEQKVQLQGKLAVIYEDSRSGAKLHHFVDVAGQRFSLHFANDPPTNALTGSIVRVKGVQVQQAIALTSGSNNTSFQTLAAAPLPKTFGAQSTLVILVNFQNNTSQPYSPTAAYDVTFGSGKSVTNFDLENSYGQTWLTGNVVGWYTLPVSSTCDLGTISSNANQAATAAGVNLSAYSHFVYGFPSSGCGWWGMSYVGGTQSWIQGSYQLVPVAHEMGHQFGLYHSHSLNCLPNIDTGSCSIVEYGDPFDTMGDSPWVFPGPHFNPFQKERLGWLNYGSSQSIVTVQSSGTYTIGPYEAQDGTAKALKIFDSTDPSTGLTTWYYVDFRQALGFDSFLSNYSNVTGGILVRLGTDSSANSSKLLDLAPALSSWTSPALDAGLTFTDPLTGTSIQTVAVSSTGATVQVSMGNGATCTHSNPAVAISPSQSTYVAAGTTVAFTVSVKNTDNSACSASSFGLTDSVPSGWSAALSNPSLTVAPGSTASTTLQVTSPTGTANGFYTAGATATNSSATTYKGSASATYALSAPVCTPANPTVSLSPAQSVTVSPGATVSYTVAVKNNDSSGCTTSTFDLNGSAPSGWSAALANASLSLAPGASASSSLQVTSPTSAANGSYPVKVTATNASNSAYTSSGSATYLVGSTSLAITIAANQASYLAGQTVVLSVRVTSGGAPASGVGVTVNITKPGGATVTQTATTGSNGTTTVSYKLKKRDPAGTYTAQAVVNSTGAAASMGATTSFTVQ